MQDIKPSGSGAEQVTLKDVFLKLQEYFQYLLSQWKIISVIAVLGASLGLLYALNQPTVYKAELSFVLDDDASSAGSSPYGNLASQFGLNLFGSSGGGGAFVGDNLLALMQSRFMIEKTLLTTVEVNDQSQTLAELFLTVNSKSDKTSEAHFPVGLDRVEFTRQQDSVLGNLYRTLVNDNLTVGKKDKKVSLLSVIVKSKSEVFSKIFAEQLVKEVSGFYVDTKTKRSARNLAILQFQTDSVRRELNTAISGVASSIDANPNPNPALQTLRVPSQRKQVDAQSNQAMFVELIKNLEAAKVTLRRETPLFQVIDRPIFPLEKEGFGRLKGIILGGLFTGFLTVSYFLIRKLLKDIMDGQSDK